MRNAVLQCVTRDNTKKHVSPDVLSPQRDPFETGNHKSQDEARGCPDQGDRSDYDSSSFPGNEGQRQDQEKALLRSTWDPMKTFHGIMCSQLYTSRISKFSAANSSSRWNISSHKQTSSIFGRYLCPFLFKNCRTTLLPAASIQEGPALRSSQLLSAKASYALYDLAKERHHQSQQKVQDCYCGYKLQLPAHALERQKQTEYAYRECRQGRVLGETCRNCQHMDLDGERTARAFYLFNFWLQPRQAKRPVQPYQHGPTDQTWFMSIMSWPTPNRLPTGW